MSQQLSRRQFLRSAGGVTFLALSPIGRGLFAATQVPEQSGLPLFTALPYIQPGDQSPLVGGHESLVIAWQTEAKPATFELTFGEKHPAGKTAPIMRTLRGPGNETDSASRWNYHATLTFLALGKTYLYRVRCNGQTLIEGYVTTRKPRGVKTRFVAFGDNSYGGLSDHAIAYQAYQARPDFVMNTGDNVYDGGRDSEYARFFFPIYNADVAGPDRGAPLLRSVPFYTVMANHDVHAKDSNNHPAADFDRDPDALAYYTAMHLPLNGPVPAQPTPTVGALEYRDRFAQCAGPRFPRMANYSFDYGDLHFLCLDSNVYVDPTNTDLQQWVTHDLKSTNARWKFVAFHHPAFNVGAEHYREQHMRVLSPIFEAQGVDFCLHGHEHTYQRTQPLTFQPTDSTKASLVGTGDRRVPGTFTVDRQFDGKTITQPKGILYITTGAGGAHLYDIDYNGHPERWTHADDNNVAYVANMVTDRHSLTVFDVDGPTLLMRQVDEYGQEIDRIRVTKGEVS